MNKPSAAKMAGFQESVAAEVLETLEKEFADIVGRVLPAKQPGRIARRQYFAFILSEQLRS